MLSTYYYSEELILHKASPSAVPGSLKAFAAFSGITEAEYQTAGFVRKCRLVQQILNETLSALRLGNASKRHQLFTDETSRRQSHFRTSNRLNCEWETQSMHCVGLGFGEPPFHSSGPLRRLTQGNRKGSWSWDYASGNGKKEKLLLPPLTLNLALLALSSRTLGACGSETKKNLHLATLVRWLSRSCDFNGWCGRSPCHVHLISKWSKPLGLRSRRITLKNFIWDNWEFELCLNELKIEIMAGI